MCLQLVDSAKLMPTHCSVREHRYTVFALKASVAVRPVSAQGGLLEIGAPTGRWQLICVYRGRHCPVSKNYLASIHMIHRELQELNVEVIAVSGDGRERAESFVSPYRWT